MGTHYDFFRSRCFGNFTNVLGMAKLLFRRKCFSSSWKGNASIICKSHDYQHDYQRMIGTGRIQILLRESVKFLNFWKLFWSCDSPLKVGPMLKIWAPLAQRTLIFWPKCPSTSLREKYPKKIKNLKTDKCIGISMQNYPEGFLIGQIRHEILRENACWNSAISKSRHHQLSRNNSLYILIL